MKSETEWETRGILQLVGELYIELGGNNSMLKQVNGGKDGE